ncbi:hypothetical protein KAS10_00095, partial [Candidatus Aerophobetes bacterium]|nr:hypothetical protein [Candidatus Aerophobetes bacterium]
CASKLARTLRDFPLDRCTEAFDFFCSSSRLGKDLKLVALLLTHKSFFSSTRRFVEAASIMLLRGKSLDVRVSSSEYGRIRGTKIISGLFPSVAR